VKLKVFTVYDSKVEAYLSPFVAPTKGVAIRSITDAVANPKSEFHRWPGDYTLFEIGEYDNSTAIYTMHKAQVNLGCLIEFAKSEENDPRQIPLIEKAVNKLNSKEIHA